MTISSATTPAAAPSGGGPRRLDLIITAAAPAAWGLTYVVTTELLPPGRPLLAAALRALPAGLALFAITRYRPRGAWWWKAAVLGLCNIGAFFVLLFVAAYRLPGGVAATLGSIQPLVAAGLASVLIGERFRAVTAIAGLLGVTGVGLLVLQADAALDTIGVVAGLAGAASMATGVVLTKLWGRPVPLAAFTSWQLIAGGVLLVPLALAVEGGPPAPTLEHLIGFGWLATGGTAVAYLLWFRGIARLPVGQVSLLGLMSPVVATLAGLVVLDQTLTAPQLIGAALVLSAIRLGQRPAPADPAPAQSLPADAVPAGMAPTQSPPADALPAGMAPAPSLPADAVPAGMAPTQSPPADALPAGMAPAQSVPAGMAPAPSLPADAAVPTPLPDHLDATSPTIAIVLACALGPSRPTPSDPPIPQVPSIPEATR